MATTQDHTSPSSTTMQIATKTDRSFLMGLLQFLIKPIGTKLISPKREFPVGSPELDPHSKAKKRCHITSRQPSGIWIYDLVAKDRKTGTTAPGQKPPRRQHVYYFAGGGWQMPPSPEHWKTCAELAHRLPNSTISIISYPLAPNSAAKDSLPQLQTLYPQLFSSIEPDEEIIFAGDSAGGNVALGLVLFVLEATPSAPVPSKLMLISPALDLRPQPQDIFKADLAATAKRDPLLSIPFINGTAGNWSQGLDPALPHISPLLADVNILKERGIKVFGITAGNDVLAPPAKRFAEVCRENGVEGRWLHAEGQMHCYVLAWIYGLSDSKEGLDWIVEALKE